ncbi:MAG: DUF3108 domain-containing protein [Candidatus Cloacimonadaceae bacterium]
MSKKLISLIFFLISLIFAINLHSVITDGEKLTFTIKYGIINAAEATLEIKSTKLDDTPVWKITSNARTYPFFDSVFKVRDVVESWWEKENLRTLCFSKRLNEGTYRQYRVQTYDHNKKTAIYKRWNFKKGTFKTNEVPIPANTQDILSAFYYVRQQDLYPGKNVLVDISTDGESYRTQVVIHRRETIDSIFGKKQCLVIEPQLKSEAIFKQSGRILIWITDDPYKIPLKLTSQITFGAFTAVLKSAENVPYPIVND